MKKFLLGTSALVGVAAFAAGAHAEPTVSLGGYFDFQAGFADQDLDTGTFSRDAKFANDTKVDVNVEGTSDNGLRYGSVIRLQADLNTSADSNGLNAERTYLFVESNAGRVEAGSNLSASNNLKVDAATIARATGGVDGDWYRFINASNTTFIIRPDLPTDHARGTGENANKITYYSPRFSGFQVGVSFTPDNGDAGTYLGATGDNNAGQQENVFSVGGNYRGQFDQVGVQASATGEFGSAETNATEDLSAYNLGAVVSFQGFSVAGSWGEWDDSNLAVAAANSDQQYFTAGAAYATGPFGVSVTYLNAERQNNDTDLVSVGADYQLAPGLVPYIEANFFELDAAGTVNDNEGSAILVGTQLSF